MKKRLLTILFLLVIGLGGSRLQKEKEWALRMLALTLDLRDVSTVLWGSIPFGRKSGHGSPDNTCGLRWYYLS